MRTTTTEPGWNREERMLDVEELGYLSKNALALPELFGRYGLRMRGETPTPAELDALFRRWLSDAAAGRPDAVSIVTILGITFGNYLCEARNMHWIEVRDSNGVTYAVRHSSPDVYAFPIDSVRKHIDNQSPDLFVEIDSAIKDAIERSN